jgi:pimeloyl-ACP methyl ester carboxylesterase
MRLLASHIIFILFFVLSSACSNMSATLPSIVLVPGAWTAPKAYHKLIAALEAKAFQVYVPALPTNNGQQPPNSTFDADIQAVRDAVQPLVDAGQEVILLMHSYGGIAGTSAIRNLTRKDRRARDLPGGVVTLIYAAGFMLSEGQTIRTVVHAVNLPGRNSLVKFSSDNSTWFPIDPIWLLYFDLAPADQEEQVRLLKWGNAAILTGQTTYAAWKDVPTLYIRSLKDRWLPPEFQDFCLQNAVDAGAPVRVAALDSGHSPYVNFAAELAQMTLEAARAHVS